jgi:hypothetical protein
MTLHAWMSISVIMYYSTREQHTGCPGAGSLAVAAGAVKKAENKIVPSASRALCYA